MSQDIYSIFKNYFGWIAEAAKTFNPYNYPDDELNDMFNKPRIGESMEDFKKRKGIKNEE